MTGRRLLGNLFSEEVSRDSEGSQRARRQQLLQRWTQVGETHRSRDTPLLSSRRGPCSLAEASVEKTVVKLQGWNDGEVLLGSCTQ